VLEQTLGPDHPSVAEALNNLGVALGSAGRHADALSTHERSLALRDKLYGPDSIESANARNGVGLALVELGRAGEAVATLERSLAIRDRVEGPPADLAEARFALARAIAETDRKRAQSLATQALDAYRSPPLFGAYEREAGSISTWLDTHAKNR
jgi:serine/threonine-protein kinase